MIVKSTAISDPQTLSTKPMKVWHSCWGKILTVEMVYSMPFVYYQTEQYADQEFYSLLAAVPNGVELPNLRSAEPKYIRTIVFDQYTLHFYTNI